MGRYEGLGSRGPEALKVNGPGQRSTFNERSVRPQNRNVLEGSVLIILGEACIDCDTGELYWRIGEPTKEARQGGEEGDAGA